MVTSMIAFVPFRWPWVWFPSSGPVISLAPRSTPTVRVFPHVMTPRGDEAIVRLEGPWWNRHRSSIIRYLPVYPEEFYHVGQWVNHVVSSSSSSFLIACSFIVLEHDLYPQTVDLAIGYTLPAALNFTPKLTVKIFSELGSGGWCADVFDHRWIPSDIAVAFRKRTCTAKATRTRVSRIRTSPAAIRPCQPGRATRRAMAALWRFRCSP